MGLTPTIRIWEVSALSHVLVVTDEDMTEIGDGFYKYNFSTYDDTKRYVFRADGGVGLANNERYEYAATEELTIADSSVTSIVDGVWDEAAGSHLLAGSTGEMLAHVKADTSSISISNSALTSLVNTLLKYERNRTKIDTVNKTLTVYDDDCTTVLHTFSLRDSSGNPSVSEVCDRVPINCP